MNLGPLDESTELSLGFTAVDTPQDAPETKTERLSQGVYWAVLVILLTLGLSFWISDSDRPGSGATVDPGWVHFDPPRTLRYRQPSEIVLRIEPAFVVVNQPFKPSTGEPIGVATEMEVHIRPEGATVVSLTPERTGVRKDQTAVWRWSVTPTATDELRLTADVSLILPTANGPARFMERSLSRRIEVKTTLFDYPYWSVHDHWQVLLGNFGLAFFTWLVQRIVRSWRMRRTSKGRFTME